MPRNKEFYVNIFHKIAILFYVNKNKDNVEYLKNQNGAYSVHTVTISQPNFFVSIEMQRDYYLNTFFSFRYHFPDQPEQSVAPCRQSSFDKMFISKMYSKMLNSYIAKNGMPVNQSR